MKFIWSVYALIVVIVAVAGGAGVLVFSTVTRSSSNSILTTSERAAPESNEDSAVSFEVMFDGFPVEVEQIAPLLDSLHRTAVRSFVSAPEFGANRARLYTLKYAQFKYPILHLPPTSEILEEWGQKAHVRVSKYGTLDEMEGYEAWAWIHALYRITARGFVYFEGDLLLNSDKMTGKEAERDDRLLVGMPHQGQSLDFAGGQLLLEPVSPLGPEEQLWKLKKMELISVLKHDPPQAYVYKEDFLSEAKTRNLDAFESQALDQLKHGKETVLGWSSQQQQISFVGAIRATDACLKCHEDKSHNDVLGAFSYQLTIDVP